MTATKAQQHERFRIRGRVQGVGFRYTMHLQARSLGLTGWCRNEANGDVVAEIFGPAEQIEALAVWCHQGPEHADVTEVLRENLPCETIPTTFEIHR